MVPTSRAPRRVDINVSRGHFANGLGIVGISNTVPIQYKTEDYLRESGSKTKAKRTKKENLQNRQKTIKKEQDLNASVRDLDTVSSDQIMCY
jgi:hypothetical protein